MGTPTKWITSMIERVLDSYLGKTSVRIPVENDQSNLRFRNNVVKTALVNSCTDDYRVTKLNVTDSDAQVEAILSRQALEDYRTKYPQRPFSKEEIRGYNVHLEDFELVLEYTVLNPKVHLYVQSFRVEWDSPRIRIPPQGKILRKLPVYKLIQEASKYAKLSISHIMSPAPRINDSFCSQTLPTSQMMPASQNGLMSQVHPPRQAQTTRFSMSTEGLGGTHDLLALLDQPAGIRVDRPSEQLRRLHSHPLDEGSRDGSAATAGRSYIKQSMAEPARTKDTRPVPLTLPVVARQPVPSPTDNPSFIASQPSPKGSDALLRRVGTPRPTDAGSAEQLPVSTDLAHKGTEERAHLSLQTTNQPGDAVNRVKQPLEKPRLCLEDPWKGWIRIEARDIEIPKDQQDLLALGKRRWIPPPPGESTPRGHVPPRLLEHWNKLVMQRNRATSERILGRATPKELPIEVPLPDPSSPSLRVDSDSEGEPLTSQWSESSPEQTVRRRPALPEDSSPIRGSPRNAGRVVPATNKPNPGPKSMAKDLTTKPQQGLSNRVPEKAWAAVGQVKTDPLPTWQSITDRDHVTSRDSDADSDDSMMDTSVPCPLGFEMSQSQLAGQSEREITSSGPSLPAPAPQDHVQVLDTPEKNLARSRHSQPEPSTKASLVQPFSTQSPGVGKSSSQSRILNSVGSSDKKGSSSQSLAENHSKGTDVRFRVDIVGTQMSSQGLPTQDPTSYSTAEVVPNSGGPSLREVSVIPEVIIPRSQTQRSLQGTPLSLPQDTGGLSTASVMYLKEESSYRHSVGVVSKRPASTLEDDACGPSKRSRTQPPETAEEPVSAALDRQIRIDAADSWEAEQTYGKFCRNYPNYTGDFHHFTKLCSLLQAVRDKGYLQRSFLWDDFIIRHLEDFPGYVEQSLVSETKFMDYEEYFTSTLSRPLYKKRSLTAQGIASAAAQCDSANEQKLPAPVSAQPPKPDTPFTGSLVKRFSSLQAQSVEPGRQGTLSDADMDISSAMSSPTPPGKSQSIEKIGVRNTISQAHDDISEPDGSADSASMERLVVPTSSASVYESALEYAPIHGGATVLSGRDTSESTCLESESMSQSATPTPDQGALAAVAEQRRSQIEDIDMADRDFTPTRADSTHLAEPEQHASQVEDIIADGDATPTLSRAHQVVEFEQHESQVEDDVMADREATPSLAESVTAAERAQHDSQFEDNFMANREPTLTLVESSYAVESELHELLLVNDTCTADRYFTPAATGPAPAVEPAQHETQVEDNIITDRNGTPTLAHPVHAAEPEEHESQIDDNTAIEQAAEATMTKHVEMSQMSEVEGRRDVTISELDKSNVEITQHLDDQESETGVSAEHPEAISAANAAPSRVLEMHDKSIAEDTCDTDHRSQGMDTANLPSLTPAHQTESPILEESSELSTREIHDREDQDAEKAGSVGDTESLSETNLTGSGALGEKGESMVENSHYTLAHESQDVGMVIEKQEQSWFRDTQDSVRQKSASVDTAEQQPSVLAGDGSGAPTIQEQNDLTVEINMADQEIEDPMPLNLSPTNAANETGDPSELAEQEGPTTKDTPMGDHDNREIEMRPEPQEKSTAHDIEDSIDQGTETADSTRCAHFVSADKKAGLTQLELGGQSHAELEDAVFIDRKSDSVRVPEQPSSVAAEGEEPVEQPLMEQSEQSDAGTESADEDLQSILARDEAGSVREASVEPQEPADAAIQGDDEQLRAMLTGETESAERGPEAYLEHLEAEAESDTELSPFTFAEGPANSAEHALAEPAEHSDIVMESELELLPSADDKDIVSSNERAPASPEAYSELGTASDSDANETTDSEDDESALIDERHETASIELGDEPSSSPATTQQQAQPESETEAESDANENWFLSLRHLRPTGPVWSDDPNTPFKQWVRADQAILSERDRRGGAYLPVDEKGVVQPPGYR
ncbi:uncharacterized protein BP01DRAFT_388873 [Aspergillus saccharolyticus JOP 1030-1]|uniref:Telomere replication protein EST3 n=1 Tax=Aspergillus saccharolyticus JOP 1030-1 TaxID=1450539 RepID=A0A318ZR38_9EURO|nr:hypothetical protein BP01DRAFT_388873 [Aspergillus saccharolyticus JOP 1030-1]PYH49044.1 hypothetical protein BP01DRAFT_388873 [Aspergillus saccharolyticus JOP 1030-1]